MKILTVSDRVEPTLYDSFEHDRYHGIDLILSCGDLPPEYLTFLVSKFNTPLYYVCGNHDIRFQSKTPSGCRNLHAEMIQFRGVNILGLEGSRWYNGGPYQYTERVMKRIIKRLRFKIWRKKGINIVITHAPPRKIHDAEDRCHRGFKSFLKLIYNYSPDYFIHGHIHKMFEDPSQRVTLLNHTKVINTYGYYIFEINLG